MDCGVAYCAVGVGGAKPAVPGNGTCVAAEAQVRCALVGQQVAVGCAVYFMTGRASFHLRSFMFEKEGAALISVALHAGLVFEASQPFPC